MFTMNLFSKSLLAVEKHSVIDINIPHDFQGHQSSNDISGWGTTILQVEEEAEPLILTLLESLLVLPNNVGEKCPLPLNNIID